MPTYVYRRADGTTFEVVQRITEPALTADPETGQPVQRVITSGTGLVFKGSGFYLTDYARAGQAKKKSEDQAAETKAEAKAEPKTEPKTDAKPEGTAAPQPETKPTPKADPS